jgi:hypothetical protein
VIKKKQEKYAIVPTKECIAVFGANEVILL